MNDESKRILKTSLLGTAGLMWVVGGVVLVWTVFGVHLLLGWVALFIWVWGCGPVFCTSTSRATSNSTTDVWRDWQGDSRR